MELFDKQIVNGLKPFQGLWLLPECTFSTLQRERYFRSNRQWRSKKLSSKSLKITCEGVDLILSVRLRIHSFPKNDVIHRCSTRTLVAPSAGSFKDSHFQVPSFVKHLLQHQNYFGVDYLTHPLILKFFQHPIIQYFEDSMPPPFVKGEGSNYDIKIIFEIRNQIFMLFCLVY